MFECGWTLGLLMKILPICISSKGIAGHQFQNTEFSQSVFRLISRESLNQHNTPLGWPHAVTGPVVTKYFRYQSDRYQPRSDRYHHEVWSLSLGITDRKHRWNLEKTPQRFIKEIFCSTLEYILSNYFMIRSITSEMEIRSRVWSLPLGITNWKHQWNLGKNPQRFIKEIFCSTEEYTLSNYFTIRSITSEMKIRSRPNTVSISIHIRSVFANLTLINLLLHS